ncbi:MAG: CinA family protein [Planctomycetaceae bacterium]
MPQPLHSLANEIASLLKETRTRVVFAESCTAGLVAATLSRVPGISEFHCGSSVVYRLDTKSRWLGIDPELLVDPGPGPVSEIVARHMATGVLERTPEASFSAAITGHLGPNAPIHQDGLVFIGIAQRREGEVHAEVFSHVLPSKVIEIQYLEADSLREWRQWKAVELVLLHLGDAVRTASSV